MWCGVVVGELRNQVKTNGAAGWGVMGPTLTEWRDRFVLLSWLAPERVDELIRTSFGIWGIELKLKTHTIFDLSINSKSLGVTWFDMSESFHLLAMLAFSHLSFDLLFSEFKS